VEAKERTQVPVMFLTGVLISHLAGQIGTETFEKIRAALNHLN
jgi:hypothetical protein